MLIMMMACVLMCVEDIYIYIYIERERMRREYLVQVALATCGPTMYLGGEMEQERSRSTLVAKSSSF